MTTIAVMQPYFSPYAGYFRLLVESDIFVLYDCVQFPRRGWVHRNRFSTETGESTWLTLPIRKSPQQTPIHQLEFNDDAQQTWSARLEKFTHLHTNERSETWKELSTLANTPTDFIERTLRWCANSLDIQTRFIRSSTLDIPNSLRGEDRILHIVKTLGGSRYINASGGVDLYDHNNFKAHNTTLNFLSSYTGSYSPIFERLLLESPLQIRSEIEANCTYQNL
jgi:hypothetical protein